MIDCDTPQTIEHVTAGLAGMGIDPRRLPTVGTPSDGRHFYLRLAGAPEGRHWMHLAPDVGTGELRFGPHSLAAAPCSQVDGIRYRFVAGWPEMIPGLRVIRWGDLASWLVGPVAPTITPSLDGLPLPLVKRELPQRAAMLLGYLQTAEKSAPVTILDTRSGELKTYATRSEAEIATVAMMILAGWTFTEIEDTFDKWGPGHYRDSKSPKRVLSREFSHALGTLAASPVRQQIVDLYHQAEASPWPGRGGGLERAVFLGLLSIAWQWNTLEPCADLRSLAEAAGAGLPGTRGALRRLQAAGLVMRAERWHTDFSTGELVGVGTRWRVMGEQCTNNAHKSQSCSILASTGEATGAAPHGHTDGDTAAVVSGAGGDAATAALAEVWTRLGRSCGPVYHHLGADPLTVKDLSTLTGKHRNTITRALARLVAWDLAEHAPAGWVRGSASLAAVASEVDAEGHARRRREEHDRQREGFYTHLRGRRL